jgi:transcriptional regulator with XRE-family HTH domain
MVKELTHERMLAELKKRASDSRSQSQLARDLGVSISFLSKVLTGKTPVTDGIASKLGYRKVTTFRKAS